MTRVAAAGSVPVAGPQRSLFDGPALERPLDDERLGSQLGRVFRALDEDRGRWWRLAALAERVGGSEAGVSARLRDLRKPRFGAHVIERRRVTGGLYEYRLGRAR